MKSYGVEVSTTNRKQKNKPDGKLYLVDRHFLCQRRFSGFDSRVAQRVLTPAGTFIFSGQGMVIKQRHWCHEPVRSQTNTVGRLTSDLLAIGVTSCDTATHTPTEAIPGAERATGTLHSVIGHLNGLRARKDNQKATLPFKVQGILSKEIRQWIECSYALQLTFLEAQ